MKHPNFDKWITADPNSEPAPELITTSNSRCSDFAVDELTCDYCGCGIGLRLDEHDGFAAHGDFVYQDVGGERGEIFCCFVCAEAISEHKALVTP